MASHHDPEPNGSPWTSPAFVISGIVVALVVVFAVVLLATGGGDDDGPTATLPPATTATVDPAPASASSDSTCGLPAGDQVVPTSAPPTRWELAGKIAVPTAPDTNGPGRNDDGLRSCFAHNPTGALYAAVNVLALTSVPSQRLAAIRELVAPGAGRDAGLASGSDVQDSGATIQVAGFAIRSYDGSQATVALALRVGTTAQDNALVGVVAPMTWRDGDWKFVAPADGRLAGSTSRLADLGDYAPWSGT